MPRLNARRMMVFSAMASQSVFHGPYFAAFERASTDSTSALLIARNTIPPSLRRAVR